jgi:hypothetical protein
VSYIEHGILIEATSLKARQNCCQQSSDGTGGERTVGAVGKTHLTCRNAPFSWCPTGVQPAAVSPSPCSIMTVAVWVPDAGMTVGAWREEVLPDMAWKDEDAL